MKGITVTFLKLWIYVGSVLIMLVILAGCIIGANLTFWWAMVAVTVIWAMVILFHGMKL